MITNIGKINIVRYRKLLSIVEILVALVMLGVVSISIVTFSKSMVTSFMVKGQLDNLQNLIMWVENTSCVYGDTIYVDLSNDENHRLQVCIDIGRIGALKYQKKFCFSHLKLSGGTVDNTNSFNDNMQGVPKYILLSMFGVLLATKSYFIVTTSDNKEEKIEHRFLNVTDLLNGKPIKSEPIPRGFLMDEVK